MQQFCSRGTAGWVWGRCDGHTVVLLESNGGGGGEDI